MTFRFPPVAPRRGETPAPLSPLLRQPLSRRRFVEGLALGAAGLALGTPRVAGAGAAPADTAHPLAAAGPASAPATGTTSLPAVPELHGNVPDLAIGEQRVNLTGRVRTAITVNGSLPAPVLRLREGDLLTVRVTNHLAETTSIHWHGLLLPADMDGVPGLSFDGIRPGETFTYRFPLRQSGTYWYHSHSAMQEARGLYGALVIAPREPEAVAHDREHVVVLSDWSDEDPHRILGKLRRQGSYYNFHQRTVADFFRDVKARGLRETWRDRAMWGVMRMTPTDLADVSGYTYTYLVNGASPAGNWTGLFRRGERVRLRFINAAAMTYFDVRIPGVTMTVVAADGQPVVPVDVDEFRLGVAETLDVIVTPEVEACTIFAQSMDRTGYARATLATAPGLVAPVPALDPRPLLTMADMGHGDHGAHGGHGGHGAHGGQGGHGGHGSQGGSAGHGPSVAAGAVAAGVGHGGAHTAGHARADTGHAASAQQGDHGAHAADGGHGNHGGHDAHAAPAGHAGHDAHAGHRGGHGADAGHAGHAASAPEAPPASVHGATPGPAAPPARQRHPASEQRNPGVDMQADYPSPRLADPGVGLRDNGRRVLTYADLRSAFPDPDGRAPSREIELHLTGHMERYVWSFDGIPFAGAEPIVLRYGERVRFTLVNDTMMEHPIHLHGMWSDLEDEDGNFLVRKHTVSMPPGTRRRYRVTADALGRWAYHCHLLMHMELGMFREVRVLP